MAKAKYIMIDSLATTHGYISNIPIIFPECITHKQMAEKFGGKENINSAGFVSIGSNSDFGNEYHPYGESVSLGKKSDPDDARFIRRMFEEY